MGRGLAFPSAPLRASFAVTQELFVPLVPKADPGVGDGDVHVGAPRPFMSFVGLVPREHSSGPTERRGGITKTGNAHLRRVLGERHRGVRRGAWGEVTTG